MTTTDKPSTSSGSEQPESIANIAAPVVKIALRPADVTADSGVETMIDPVEEDESKFLMKYEDYQ